MSEGENNAEGSILKFFSRFRKKDNANLPPSPPDSGIPLEELELQIQNAPDKEDPQVIGLTRRYLMKKTELKLTEEERALLKGRIIYYDPLQYVTNNEPVNQRLKFVREDSNFILFPAQDNDNYMHIDYAVAAGMTNPDDGGVITIDADNRKFVVETGCSSSLHINPKNNPERAQTIEKLRRNLPSGFRLEELEPKK